MKYANVGPSFIQNEPKSIANAYNIRKSTTDFVRLYIENYNIGKFQREKKRALSAAALYAIAVVCFCFSKRTSFIFFIHWEHILGTEHVIMIYLNFITVYQVG